jgi:predicted kinase
MAILFIITGLPLSGKSAVARVLGTRLGADVIDLDGLNELRGVNTPTGTPMIEWARTHELAERYIRGSLELGRHVVVDWVNYPDMRERWRRVGAEVGAEVRLLHVTTSAEMVRQRYGSALPADIDPEFFESVIGRWTPPEQAIRLSGVDAADSYVSTLLGALRMS